MFAYCLNNPVNGSDPCGTCCHRLDFWNDCKKCGGETYKDKWNNIVSWCKDAYETIVSVHQTQVMLDTQIRLQQIEMISDGVNAVWDAYNFSVESQANAQLQIASAVNSFIADRFSTAEKAANTFAACAVTFEGIARVTKACPQVSAVFDVVAWACGGIAVVIAIFDEE